MDSISINLVLRALSRVILFWMILCAFLPTFLFAAHGDGELININTADAQLLDTLDGIGPSRAQDIIEYRTTNGAFASIEDISNVSGIGGPGSASYEKIKDHITVDEVTDTTTTSTTTQNQSSETVVTNVTQFKYESVVIQPPQDVHIRVAEKLTTVVGAFTRFEFESYDATGNAVEDGRVTWAFGDGATATGRDVGHSFLYEGTYVVHVSLKKGTLADTKTITVTVLPLEASLHISETGDWVSITNHSDVPLNVSQWRITTDYNYFVIPDGTYIQSGTEVRFPTEITKLSLLSGTKHAFLRYPNGEVVLDSKQEMLHQDEEETIILTEEESDAEEKVTANQTNNQSIVNHPITVAHIAQEAEEKEQEIIETIQEETKPNSTTSKQQAAVILSGSAQTSHTSIYWYSALGALLLFAIVGVLFVRPRKLIVEGYEVIETKE